MLFDNNKALKEYEKGETLIEFLAVRKANILPNKNKPSNYLDTILSDGKTDVLAKQWDYTGELPQENTIIKVEATMDNYQGQPQLIIKQWRQAYPGECDPGKFIPKSPEDLNQLMAQVEECIKDIQHPGLQKLVEMIIDDIEMEFMIAPAGLKHHHNYLGGLLEHTVGVVNKCFQLADPKVNMDLLLAGAILHDIGKIKEYDWSGCTIQMDNKGRLLGHIPLGLMMVNEYISKVPELDEETARLLLHLIASHNGKLEWGSPVEPMIKEAVILHNADLIDSQMWKINHAQADVEPGNWTCKIYGSNKEFYVPKTWEVLNNEQS